MNNAWNKGAQDAQQGKGAANTNGMHHAAASAYNAGYQHAQQNKGNK